MIFNLTTRRNSVHLAWLLLLVPPLARSVVDWSNDNPVERVVDTFRVLGALTVVMLLLWLRGNVVAGRAVRLLKDLRTLMPGTLVAILVPGLLALNGEREAMETGSWFFAFGCLMMGAATFGSEFEQRTIGGLLGQPVSRGKVYREKLAALGGMLFLVGAVYAMRAAWVNSAWSRTSDWLVFLWVPVFVFCSAPLFSLLTRSTLAGLVFTLTTPFFVALSVMLTLEMSYRVWYPGTEMPEVWFWWLMGIGTPAYLIGTSWLGWRVFRGLEIRDGGAGGRSSTSLHPLSLPMDALLGRLSPSMGGAGRLLRKELRLHVVPWLVAGLMVVLWALWMIVRRTTTDEGLRSTLNEVPTLTAFMGIFGALIVVATGAASVAEERELGTLEWQLTQPVSVRRQWWTKVAVVGVLSVVLGVILPAVLVFLGFDRERLGATFGDVPPVACWAFAGIFLLVGATSVYASSFSRNTMTAVAAAVAVGAVLGGMAYAIGVSMFTSWDEAVTLTRLTWEASPVPVLAPPWAPTKEGLMAFGIALVAVFMLVPFVGMLWMGMRNFRTLGASTATVVRQLATIIAVCLAIGWVGGKELWLCELRLEQVSWVEEMAHRRAAAVKTVESLAKGGRLTPEIMRRYGLATNASPTTLVDAVIAKDGPSAADRIDTLPEVAPLLTLEGVGKTAAERYRMDPILARRYGLIPKGPPIEAASGTNLPAAGTNPPAFKMDPAMMKRYGLQPRPSP